MPEWARACSFVSKPSRSRPMIDAAMTIAEEARQEVEKGEDHGMDPKPSGGFSGASHVPDVGLCPRRSCSGLIEQPDQLSGQGRPHPAVPMYQCPVSP